MIDDTITKALGPVLSRKLGETPVLAIRSASSVSDLMATYGIDRRQAHKVIAIRELSGRIAAATLERGMPFRSSRDLFRHFGPRLRDLKVEQFRVVLLDGKHRVIKDKLISQGTLTSSPVHPREVFAPAISYGAAAIVLVHNHPSGDPTPSADDLAITRRLVDVGELIGIRVLDHVICGDGTHVSLADRGLI